MTVDARTAHTIEPGPQASVTCPASVTCESARRISRRKLVGMGLGMAGAGALLAASGATAASAGNARSISARPAAIQDGTVTIRFMRFAGLGWEHDTQFADQFMEAHPNIKVEGEDVIYAEMFNKCVAQGATGNLADVFAGHNRWVPYLAYKGITRNLDPDVEAGMFTDFDDFFTSAIDDARSVGTDGQLHWIPTAVHPAGNAVVVFNMDIMEQAGVPLPESNDWTIADYEEIIRAAARPEENILGTDVVIGASPLYAQQYTRTWGTDAEAGSDDAWLLSRDGRTQQLGSQPVKDSLEWYHQLVVDRMAPTSGEKAALEGSGVDHFNAGMLATRAGTVGTPAQLRHQIGDRFEIQARLWPKGPHGHRGSCLSYNTQSVWSQSENPEEAVKFLDFMTGPDIAFWIGYEGSLHPMARRSAWFNPQLWERFPVMEAAANWLDSGVDPFPQPWNLRFMEWLDAWNQETTAYFSGEENWDEMYQRTQDRCQSILDLDRP